MIVRIKVCAIFIKRNNVRIIIRDSYIKGAMDMFKSTQYPETKDRWTVNMGFA